MSERPPESDDARRRRQALLRIEVPTHETPPKRRPRAHTGDEQSADSADPTEAAEIAGSAQSTDSSSAESSDVPKPRITPIASKTIIVPATLIRQRREPIVDRGAESDRRDADPKVDSKAEAKVESEVESEVEAHESADAKTEPKVDGADADDLDAWEGFHGDDYDEDWEEWWDDDDDVIELERDHVRTPFRPWQRAAAGLALLSLVVVGIGLAGAGAQIVRRSTDGDVFAPVQDPNLPAFEAFLEPTPTAVMLHSIDGLIDSVTVLSLPGGEAGGGGVLMVPVRTVGDLPVLGVNAIEYAYDLGDAELEREVVQDLLGIGLDELIEVDAARWAALVAPVAPLTLENPDVLRGVDEDGRSFVHFEAGVIELEADDVGPYLESIVVGESDLARLFRHEVFWKAWLEAVADDGRVEAVPGEVDNGIGRFVRLLSAGEQVIATLPVRQTREEIDEEGIGFEPNDRLIGELIAELVPFPTAARPGGRARVRVLNGTTALTQAGTVARMLPPLGTEIVLLGNAQSFDVETTTVSFFGVGNLEIAEEILNVLGVGVLVEEARPSEVLDITVTLGADYG